MNKANAFLLFILAGMLFVVASASVRAFEVFAIVLGVLVLCDRLYKKSHS